MFGKTVSKALRFCDSSLALLSDSFFLDSASLIIFTFHSLFALPDEIETGDIDPQQGITVGMLRNFISDFQAHGYRFVAPGEIVNGLDLKSKYALITFDDGYYNNLRALPILEELHTPAVFCISAEHINTGKSFWWDVLYREAKKRQWPPSQIEKARSAYKLKRAAELERALVQEFGKNSLDPASDLDRPMTPAELKQLANYPLCSIGNHTVDHAILTNYTGDEARQQISGAQQFIQKVTGSTPELIAYPNGNASPEIVRIARDAGLQLGVTVQPGKNRIRDLRNPDKALALKRFTLWGSRQVEAQCRNARAALSLTSAVAGWRMKYRYVPSN